jgi:hypothetical protein
VTQMPRASATFKQADVVRMIKAARAAGLEVARTEIAPDGRIVLVHKSEPSAAPLTPYDEWKAKHDARSA